MSSPESNILYLSEKRKAQHAMLHPRSTHDGQSRYVDPYANFQMPLHFDRYNPATWPVTAASTNEPAHGINMYCQQPPNPALHVTGPHSNGGHGNTSKPRVPHPQDAVKLIQHDGGQYTRETAPPALLPSPTPTKSVVVPQGAFSRPPPSILLPPIDFTPKGWHASGVNIPCRLSAEHDIENPHDKVFISSQGMREIIVKIQWPGYALHPFEIQISTKKGNLTRRELLDSVCRVVIEFSTMLKERGAHVQKGNRMWAIGKTGLDVERIFIARLLHRGGNYFQPEMWVPI